MRSLVLSPGNVSRLGHLSARRPPLGRESVGVIDMEVKQSSAGPRRVGAVEVKVETLPLGEGVALVVERDLETESLVVLDRPRHVRDREDRIGCDDARQLSDGSL